MICLPFMRPRATDAYNTWFVVTPMAYTDVRGREEMNIDAVHRNRVCLHELSFSPPPPSVLGPFAVKLGILFLPWPTKINFSPR